jgi:plastocyanin
MPNIFRKGSFAFIAFTIAIGGSPAVAQTLVNSQTILILDEAFFPAVSYVRLGDKLTFINQSDDTRIVEGANNAWTSGGLATGGTFVYVVDEKTPLEFTSIFGNEAGLVYQGTLSFDEPPL